MARLAVHVALPDVPTESRQLITQINLGRPWSKAVLKVPQGDPMHDIGRIELVYRGICMRKSYFHASVP
jgi:hypothetical protein